MQIKSERGRSGEREETLCARVSRGSRLRRSLDPLRATERIFFSFLFLHNALKTISSLRSWRFWLRGVKSLGGGGSTAKTFDAARTKSPATQARPFRTTLISHLDNIIVKVLFRSTPLKVGLVKKGLTPGTY